VEITVIATGFQNDDATATQDDDEDDDEAHSKEKYAEFLAKRIQSGKVSATAYDEDELELAESAGRNVGQNVARDTMTSRVEIDEDDIPPFLRKLRNKK